MDDPKKVADDQIQHILIVGPPKCGKTTLAQYLQKEHRRKVINMGEILEWNIEQGTEVGMEAEQELKDRR